MKKLLSKFFKNIQTIYYKWFRKAKQDSMADKQEIPLEQAYRMWKEEQKKPLTYGEALKRYLDSTNLFEN